MNNMEEKTNETESLLLGDSKEENEKMSETADRKLPDQKNNNISETTEKILPDQETEEKPHRPEKKLLKPRRKIVNIAGNGKKHINQMNKRKLDGPKKILQEQKKKRNENIPEKIKTSQLDDKNKEKHDGSSTRQQEEGRKNGDVPEDVQPDEENKDELDRSEKGQQEEKRKTEGTENNQSNQMDKEELDGCEKNKWHESGENEEETKKKLPDENKREKLDGSEKSHQKERQKKMKQSIQRGRKSVMNRDKHVLPDGDQKNEFNKEKPILSERDQRKEKRKDRPGGIIFMCSSKTKPDCFHYQIMGVSMGKKDVVLSIKPGMKLFLYDFDLKLLYGIYRASSSGGTKLEPAAFGGAFPAQVRFEIHKDCFPLPESVFKKAIKENYDRKNKFKTELTAQQVRKLTVLFRPADVRSSAHIITPNREKPRDREPHKKTVDSRPYSYGDRYGRDSYLMNVSRGSNVRRDVASTRREEVPHESFLSEQEYRTYGLCGKPRSPTPPRHAPVDSYPRDHKNELYLRHPPHLYREIVPAHDSCLYDPTLLDGREYRSYALSAPLGSQFRVPLVTPAALDPYSNDPYPASQVHALSTDPYGRSVRTEELYPRSPHYIEGGREIYLPETDHARREIGLGDRSYSAYASDSLPDYRQRYHRKRAESTFAPVSSRYTFASPSSSRR